MTTHTFRQVDELPTERWQDLEMIAESRYYACFTADRSKMWYYIWHKNTGDGIRIHHEDWAWFLNLIHQISENVPKTGDVNDLL